MRNGILAGGNWIMDQVKVIDKYPAQEALANILEEYSSNGGSAYNILKGLSRMQMPFPLEGIGLVGNDMRGESILNECNLLSVNTKQIKKTDFANTSYTDVMSVKSNGRRTFFHYRGANALLSETDFDLKSSQSKIFHLGYILLLDRLDFVDAQGLSGAAKLLREAGELGFLTSADLVSEDSDRFVTVVPPALPYIDYLFVNEFEAKMLTGIETVNEKQEISPESCLNAAKKILQMGVRKWVIVHYPYGIVAACKSGEVLFLPCINVPAEKIRGTVGAGDAFAAGVLAGLHQDWGMRRCLELGVCVAASSLLEPTCSDGIMHYEKCLLLAEEFGFGEACPL
jgi:sugar/nucleoside kinase (ribokinase family)